MGENERYYLTEQAKSIIGDVVEVAYCQKPSWADNLNVPPVSDTSIDPNDGYPVLIKFTNGKSIKFMVI